MTEEELQLMFSQMMSSPQRQQALKPPPQRQRTSGPSSREGGGGRSHGGGSSPGITPAAPMADYLMKFGSPGAMLAAYRGGPTSSPGTKRSNSAQAAPWSVLVNERNDSLERLLSQLKKYGGGSAGRVSGTSGSVLNGFGGEQQRRQMDDDREVEMMRRQGEMRRMLEKQLLQDKLGLFGGFMKGNSGTNTTTRQTDGGVYENVGGRPTWMPTSSTERTTAPSITPEMILQFLGR